MAEVHATLFPAGKLRYANNSNYKNDVMIRKEVILHLCFSVKVGEMCALNYYVIFPSLTCIAVS